MPKLTPVHHQTLIKVFKKAGFVIVRRESSHIMMEKKDLPRPLVIPSYPEVPVSIIKGLLRSARMTREEYLRYLS
jgi:predicted RNA binding protein YcfA (HicA-like mRNA interferase family)